MEKRKLQVTTKDTYILTTEGKKLFLREVVEEPEVGFSLYDLLASYLFPSILMISGWMMFLVSIAEGR